MANNITVKDATEAAKTLKTTENATVHTPHHNVDALPGTVEADTGTTATQTTAAAVSLAVIDDWDEANRAKVNPIDGQAGVAAGAGIVGATVQRMTLASDDPAVAKLGTIDTDTGVIAGAVSGSEMQVDVVTLPAVVLGAGTAEVGKLAAGTAAIGKLAANVGVTIGDVGCLPDVQSDLTWIVTGAINADFTSSAIASDGLKALWMVLEFSATTDPIGELYFQGSIDDSQYFDLTLDAAKVYGVLFTHTGGETNVTINDPASEAVVAVCIENPPPYVKVFYDRTSGGTATGLTGKWWGRSL